MSRSVADSRLALSLRRLRGRFGITAPQVAVRTHVPWHLRVVMAVVLFIVGLGLIVSAYNAGRRVAGFDREDTGRAIEELRHENDRLNADVARLGSLLAERESTLQIERATQKELTNNNAILFSENAKLREDLAVFENLSRLEGKSSEEVTLDRLSVRQVAPGQFHYSFLISLQGARRGKVSRFELQIAVAPSLENQGAKVLLPAQGATDSAPYVVELKNFRRIDGRFGLPKDYKAGSVEIRILEAGRLKASKRLEL